MQKQFAALCHEFTVLHAFLCLAVVSLRSHIFLHWADLSNKLIMLRLK